MSVTVRRTSVPYDVRLPEPGTIIDILKKYTEICSLEFCGKCMPCRYGTKEWDLLLHKFIEGRATHHDVVRLEEINHLMLTSSLCRLGLVSPYLVQAVLKYFKEDIHAIINKKDPAYLFTELPKFEINTNLCNGCAHEETVRCVPACSAKAISGGHGEVHIINQEKCYRCDACVTVCPQKAIVFC